MNTLGNIYELLGIFNTIPEGTDEKICINDLEVSLTKNDGKIDIKIEVNQEDCDDYEEVRKMIAKYKENIEALDDNTFLEILDEMKEVIDIKEFDDLLELDSFTDETAARVEGLIEHSTLIIHKFLQNKIQNLMELYERFE